MTSNKNSQYVEPGFLSRLFFTWLLDLFKLGARRPLTQEDLNPLSDEFKSKNLVQKLEETWSEEVNYANRDGRRPQLWKAIILASPLRQYLRLMTLKLTEMNMKYAVVVLLSVFFGYLQEDFHVEKWHAPLIVLGIGICSYIKVFCYHHTDHLTLSMGMQMKVAVIGMVYNKILSMKSSSIKTATSGVILNLLSNDAQRMEELVSSGIFVIFGLLSIPFGILLLWVLVGWQSLSGILVLLIFAVFQTGLLSAYARLRYKQKKATDERLAAVKDVISGIRAVKMYALEWKFSDKIKSLRRNEIKQLRLLGAFTAFAGSQFFTLSQIATLVSIATLIYCNVHTNVVNTFTVVLFYNLLGVEVALFCNLDFIELVHSFTSLERFQEFFMLSKDSPSHKNIEDQKRVALKDCVRKYTKRSSKYAKYSLLASRDDSYDSKEVSNDAHEDPACHIMVNKMSAGWFEDDEQCTLHDISFAAEPNQLLMVTGSVGSGKSTLLMAVLREIPINSGSISIHGKIAYVSQYPWIFTGTVRDNILFGQKFDQHRYQKVLDVCDLTEDFSRFPKGDMSLTGQRGVSLSGGQRVRVSLARAVYSNSDMYLLDDPLSALDVKVGQYIMDECICNVLSSRIRILVTHQLQHLHRADNILLMKEGRVLAQGSYQQLTNEGWIGDVPQYDSKSRKSEEYTSEVEMKHEATSLIEESCSDIEDEDEDRVIGTVTSRVYWEYLRAGLHPLLIGCFVFFYLLVQGSMLAPQLWLSQFAKLPKDQQKNSTSLEMLAVLVATAFVLSFTREWLFYNIFVNATKTLHHKMVLAVLKSPVLFFDKNPLGRILNRFSRDIGYMDNMLPETFVHVTMMGTNALAVVVLALITNIWFALIVIPLCFFFYLIFYYYLSVARDLKRLEAIKCSSIYAHTAETITGVEVVRTSQMQENFLETMARLQDECTSVLYVSMSTGRWFGLYNDLLFVTLLTAMAGISWATREDKALSAMVLSLAIDLLYSVGDALSQISEIENQMTSVERVLNYSKLPSEPGYERNSQPRPDWPSNGALTFRNVSLVYFEGGPRVLRDISFDVKPAEKIGIAGRTGAGKSSLVASLFRMPDPEGGMLIDGVDLGSIELQAARRAMAVITQDPVLFIGSLRQNLDPFNSVADMHLWKALEEVQLKQKVLSLDGQLNYTIGEGGLGLSAGERQLLCLARAILQRCKILVLDEATANIDYHTDQRIQEIIRNNFAKCTVLTIAHRLNTIVDYDKVVVLEDGQVIEHDNPKVLASKQGSIFAKLLKSSLSNDMHTRHEW